MHECVECGQYCDCDGEDLHQPAPPNCSCDHEASGLDLDGGDSDDDDCCHHCVSFDTECEDCLDEQEEEDAS